MKIANSIFITTSLLSGFACASSFVKGDATASLGTDFFVDDAATGGSDVTTNQPAQFAANRNLAALNVGADGSTVEITGFAFATSGTAGANDATELTVRLRYLGADNTLNTFDDLFIGEETVNYTHDGAGEYYVVFDAPFSAVIPDPMPNSQGRFRIEVVPSNSAGAGSVRFKAAALSMETFNGPKFTIAGTSTPFIAGNVDTDDDGILDEFETNTGIYVNASNTGTDPNNPDTDGDDLEDGDEVFGDLFTGFTSNPLLTDTDGDNLGDKDEVFGSLNSAFFNEETDPDNDDSDNDGILDGVEVLTMLTDPNSADSDGDGLTDAEEDVNRNGVVEATETDATESDTDGDGLFDGWEVDNGFDPINSDESQDDPDLDMLLNIDEFNGGFQSTDPNDSDTDNDKLSDRFEFDSTGLSGFLNPVNRDTDNDGLSDSYELANGLDPFLNDDFDSDTFTDAEEVLFYGTNPDDVSEFPGDGINPAPLGLTPIMNFGVVGPADALPIRPVASDPDALATAILNEAAQGGADLTFGFGRPNFTTLFPGLFPQAGTEVEITGIAWVVTGGGNGQGDISFEFYDPAAADADDDFDGVDCETLVGVARGTLSPSGSTGVSYFAFEEPITFTSAGTSLAVRMQSTAALRLKAQNGFGTGLRVRSDGSGAFTTNSNLRFTLFGLPANEVEPVELVITSCGFESNGDFFIEVEGGVAGKIVTGATDLAGGFTAVTTSDDGANRFTISESELDLGALGYEFFRVELVP
ncbi:MAG: hypothetical protein ACSHYB_06835 [Roseibacillus sp.]